jgi:hypothetical protein
MQEWIPFQAAHEIFTMKSAQKFALIKHQPKNGSGFMKRRIV